MQTELVRQLTIEDLSQNAVLDYIDGDIAFANRLRLPHVPHAKPVKIDALKLLICTKGTLQVDVNTKTRIIRANEVLCCLPLTVLRNAIGSDDLECKGIAISMNIVRRLVSLGGGTRDKFFYLEQNPVLPIGQKGAQIFELYHKLIGSRELTYNSNKELYAQKVVSEFSLKTSENSYLTAQAALAQAEAQETNARNNLSYTEVKSPSDGVVGALPYRVGALVSANIPQPLTTVSDNSNMYVYFSMNENQLLSLTRQYGSMDDALKNMPEVELRLNDNSIYEHKGKIESISGVIDRQTGTVTVRSVFPNEARLLHSGASGAVIIPSTYENCIVIPQEATIRLQDKTMVYKVVDGKAVSSLITVAELNDGREYVVLDGLKAGEEIVSQGAGLVREGTQVK